MNTDTQVLSHLKLHFNVRHPAMEDVWMEGYRSSLSAEDESTNPFKANSSESHYWQEGWWAGFYGEAPMFATSEEEVVAEVASNKAHVLPVAAQKTDWVIWLLRFIQLTTVVLFAVLCYELADIAT